VNDEVILVVLCFDDLIVNGNGGDSILGLKAKLKDTFEMVGFGLLRFFLDIHIIQLDVVILISWPNYALDLLKRFKMEHCMPCSTMY
jgi:hypothetical protein